MQNKGGGGGTTQNKMLWMSLGRRVSRGSRSAGQRGSESTGSQMSHLCHAHRAPRPIPRAPRPLSQGS
eukprot:6734072-Karenia_brevis.AAC.1